MVGKMSEEIPHECPLLQKCEELIPENWFAFRCRSKDWIYCEKAKEQAKKHSKKPREWLQIIFEKKMPQDWLKGKDETKPQPTKENSIEKKDKKRSFWRL